MTIWPYRILDRTESDLKADLEKIHKHFFSERPPDVVVFIPNAGIYLSELFRRLCSSSARIEFVTVRRASTVTGSNQLKAFICRKRWLANIFRHLEVGVRLVKLKFNMKQKMVQQSEIEFDVKGSRVLVIDDSVDTGTTMKIVKDILLARGASSVLTACISNHLLPHAVDVDYSLYKYRLLRTLNSSDFDAE